MSHYEHLVNKFMRMTKKEREEERKRVERNYLYDSKERIRALDYVDDKLYGIDLYYEIFR